jgi:hypothetical protein
MNKSSLLPEYSDIPLSAEFRAFYSSRLMCPEEVASATANQPPQVREATKGNWTLSGDVCPEMFALLGTSELTHFPVRLTGFRSSSGMTYGVLTHQIAHFQSRIVLHLSDPRVRQFLEAMAETSVVFMLGNDGTEQAVLVGSPLQPAMFLPLLAMTAEPLEDQSEALLEEIPLVMLEMGKPATIPSLTAGRSVHHVSVFM